MNKTDIKFIAIVSFLGLLGILILNILNRDYPKEALVYYKDKMILKIDMSVDNSYIVKGYNGIVKIEVKANKIRVVEETSPYNICSKQGFVSNSHTPIICLPNKIIIKINDQDTLDTIIE